MTFKFSAVMDPWSLWWTTSSSNQTNKRPQRIEQLYGPCSISTVGMDNYVECLMLSLNNAKLGIEFTLSDTKVKEKLDFGYLGDQEKAQGIPFKAAPNFAFDPREVGFVTSFYL